MSPDYANTLSWKEMSNIEQIKAEIERLKKLLEVSNYYLDNSQQSLGYSFALDDFEDFIGSLPDENNPEPYNPVYDEDYLNEKIAKATKSWEGVDVDKYMDETRGRKLVSKNLEEAAEEWCKINNKGIALCADKKSHYLAEGVDAFIAGAEWQYQKDRG